MSIKVICIDSSPGRSFVPFFKEGEILTQNELNVEESLFVSLVFGVCPSTVCNILEYPNDPKGTKCFWNKSRFIPISDIDETEMNRDYNIVKNPQYVQYCGRGIRNQSF